MQLTKVLLLKTFDSLLYGIHIPKSFGNLYRNINKIFHVSSSLRRHLLPVASRYNTITNEITSNQCRQTRKQSECWGLLAWLVRHAQIFFISLLFKQLPFKSWKPSMISAWVIFAVISHYQHSPAPNSTAMSLFRHLFFHRLLALELLAIVAAASWSQKCFLAVDSAANRIALSLREAPSRLLALSLKCNAEVQSCPEPKARGKKESRLSQLLVAHVTSLENKRHRPRESRKLEPELRREGLRGSGCRRSTCFCHKLCHWQAILHHMWIINSLQTGR